MTLAQRIGDQLGLSPALANHLSRLLLEEYVDLPRMEAYRLRRALRPFNTEVVCKYGRGYHLYPEDREVYLKHFKLR